MLGPLSKLAITVLLALAWLRAGQPIEPERLRSRLKWTLGLAVGLRIAFELDAFARHMLVNGLDDIGLTLQREERITAYEHSHPARVDTLTLA